LNFADTFGVRKLESLGYHVACVILRLAVSVEHRLVTDRQTHDYTAYSALAWYRAVKTGGWTITKLTSKSR